MDMFNQCFPLYTWNNHICMWTCSYFKISENLILTLGACKASDPRIVNAAGILVKLPEHTWGLPSVSDNVNWSNPQFNRARLGKLPGGYYWEKNKK